MRRTRQGTTKFGNPDLAARRKPVMLTGGRRFPCIGASRRAPSSPAKEVQVTNVNIKRAAASRNAPLHTPTDLKSNAVHDIAGALSVLLADMFALYLKKKNFHWHISGP